MGSASPSPSKALTTLQPSLRAYFSKTTSAIVHLNRLLSATPHLDTALLTLTYTLHLLHSLLLRFPRPFVLLTRLTTSLSPLTRLLDEFRVLLRLWGLLGIYSWGAATYSNPPKDWVVKTITWAQVGACAVYQALENGAYLADRGVLGWSKQRVAKAWVWSGRAWMAHVALELARLGYEYQQFQVNPASRPAPPSNVDSAEGVGGESEKVDETGALELKGDNVDVEKWEKWRTEVGVNVAYAPMTVHYSLENGILGEASIGALGFAVGCLTLGKAWRECA